MMELKGNNIFRGRDRIGFVMGRDIHLSVVLSEADEDELIELVNKELKINVRGCLKQGEFRLGAG